jgi:sugar lactone lactonase YvrE
VVPFYNVTSDDDDFQDAADTITAADFIAFTPDFLSLIGPSASLERIVNFTTPEVESVHEAPAYVPDTNELLFSTTTAIGRLWVLNLDTLELRNLTLEPPLSNINGATYHNGTVYVCTNGGDVRGILSVNFTTGATAPVVNNYRGRRLNSPNDVIFDSHGNMWFTDPAYGWYSEFEGVGEPELPQSIYFFNTTSKALQVVSNDVVHVPNGLAFSPDEKKLYVADSANLQGRPLGDTDPMGLRNVVAFDVEQYPLLSNPTLVHQTEVGVSICSPFLCPFLSPIIRYRAPS